MKQIVRTLATAARLLRGDFENYALIGRASEGGRAKATARSITEYVVRK